MNPNVYFTFSEKEKLAVFLPGKTGTMHATFILNHFDFTTSIFNRNNQILISEDNYVIHHHDEFLPTTYQDYDVIYTARNPYSRLVSMYYHDKNMGAVNTPHTNSFKEYFSRKANHGMFHINAGFNFVKKPKYILRMEHLYDDYIQIPFIKNSKLNQSGILQELCNKKIHTKKQETKSLKEYYTQDMADYVYRTIKPYFDLTGYDKDSWNQ